MFWTVDLYLDLDFSDWWLSLEYGFLNVLEQILMVTKAAFIYLIKYSKYSNIVKYYY